MTGLNFLHDIRGCFPGELYTRHNILSLSGALNISKALSAINHLPTHMITVQRNLQVWKNALQAASKLVEGTKTERKAKAKAGAQNDQSSNFEQRSKLNQRLDRQLHVQHNIYIEQSACGHMIVQVVDRLRI